MDFSIVIVNYQSRELTCACLDSLTSSDWQGLSYEIIVVDNHSDPELGALLAKRYPDVRFIAAPSNLGMGAGNNLGLTEARGRYFAVMNPDTLALPNTFTTLYHYLESQPQVGIVGPKQLNPDHSVQTSCYRWHHLLTPVYRRTPLGQLNLGQRDLDRFLMTDFDHQSIKQVDWLLGSFLLIRASTYGQLGGFDPNFFLYFEDTDLCRRAHLAGWQVVYNPEASIIHNHKRQSAQTAWWKFFLSGTTRTHITSWFKYLWKYRFR